MKRTVMLIVFLIFVASILLIYAINSKPEKKTISDLVLTPTNTVSPASKSNTFLFFTPSDLTLKPSENVNLDIGINTGENQITGVQLEIAYDPKALSDITITPGDFFNSSDVLLNKIDEETGRISYALVLPPSKSPITGTGNVAKLSAKKNLKEPTVNQSTITILDKSLVSALGIEGSVLREMVSITVTFLSPTGFTNEDKPNTGTYEAVPIYP